MTQGESPDLDPAVARARRVVGLYGDPDVTWSIVLAVDLTTPRDPADVRAAAGDLVATYPALGRVPDVTVADDGAAVLGDFANRPYGDHDPLVRVALVAGQRTLIVAAHHGALDGLGLLGAAAVLGGVDLTSSARGIERTAEPTTFLRGSLRRLVEALLAPPLRMRGNRYPEATGDWIEARDIAPGRVGSAALVAAAAGMIRAWNHLDVVPRNRRLVISMGLSRRPGTPAPAPVRDTAYMRVDAGGVLTAADASTVVAATAPEPAFPVTDGGGLGPWVTRLLASRLGASVLVSNLGLISGDVLRVRFWPVPTGPSGVCVGLASSSTRTTVTVRARRGWFSPGAAADLVELAADQLAAAARSQ